MVEVTIGYALIAAGVLAVLMLVACIISWQAGWNAKSIDIITKKAKADVGDAASRMMGDQR